MALLNLSLVTQALMKLIHARVTTSPEWLKQGNTPVTLKVSPRPPDGVKGAHALGLYLYHVSEDPHTKNLHPRSDAYPPVRYTPMGLNLYYQLTPHCDAQNEDGTYHEQLMLGLALKALHDYPCIDDTTTVVDANNATIKILKSVGLDGGDNRVRITLQPIPQDQAVSYWTAGSPPGLRLAAYHQVSVVLLEPEEPKVRPGRVLARGVHAFVSGAPRLDGSSSLLVYTIPGQPGSLELEVRPAQVSVGGTVTFSGSGLAGDSTSLWLRNARWSESIEADGAWKLKVKQGRIEAEVQATASGKDVFPGIYSARAMVKRQRDMPDGSVREFVQASNETPFVVTPDIDPNQISGPDANRFVVVKSDVFAKVHNGVIPADVLQLYLGSDELKVGTAAALQDLEYAVVPVATPDVAVLRLRMPTGLKSGRLMPLRLFVYGAESPPRWITVP